MPNLVHSYLLQHAATSPHEPALIGGGAQWSYRDLSSRVERYADQLHRRGLRRGDVIVLKFDPAPEAIALMIAAASLGVVFVNVDPSTPPQRERRIISDMDATAVVALEPSGLYEGVGVHGYFDGTELQLVGAVAAAGERAVPAETDLAYVVFTSGSTGTPKGIMMSHRAVVSFWRGFSTFGVAQGVRLGTAAPLQFDFSILDLGMALGSGGCLVQVPRILLQQPRGFVRFLARYGVTQMDGAPSIWRELISSGSSGLLAQTRLDTVLYGGEAFPLEGLRELRVAVPNLRLVNAFGHSESIACAYRVLPEPIPVADGRVSFGTAAFPGMTMTLVDEAGRPIDQPGMVGELYVEGDCLFDGYWKDAPATACAMVPSPLGTQRIAFRSGDLVVRDEQGEHYFCGRKDSQVKLGGNRVELDEIDIHLQRHPLVEQAASVLTQRDRPHIVTYLRLRPSEHDVAAIHRLLRQHCVTALPPYMVPSRFELLDRIPVTTNGKVDRAALANGLARP